MAYREKADTKETYCLQCEFFAHSLLNRTCKSCATRLWSPEVFQKTCFSASVLLFEAMFFETIFAEHQCTVNIFLKKYRLHLKLHLGVFHLIVVSHSLACSEGQNKSGKIIRLPNMIGDDPHLWNFRNLLWDLWVLALDQQNKRNKTKAEEQVFFQR